MSFEIFLQRFLDGDAADPLDGVAQELLGDACSSPPDGNGCARVERGGGSADVYGFTPGSPIEGLMFSRIQGGDGVFELVVEIARAADMVVMPVGCPVCLTHPVQREHLPPELLVDSGEPVVVHDGSELRRVVESA